MFPTQCGYLLLSPGLFSSSELASVQTRREEDTQSRTVNVLEVRGRGALPWMLHFLIPAPFPAPTPLPIPRMFGSAATRTIFFPSLVFASGFILERKGGGLAEGLDRRQGEDTEGGGGGPSRGEGGPAGVFVR